MHTGDLDHKIALDSYIRFMSAYFIFITCILAITLVIFLLHFIRIRLARDQNVFRKKLGRPLSEERLLEERKLSRSALDRLYVDVDTVNELIASSELALYVNPFHIDIIHEEYELMRLKYKEIRNRIEDKILEADGHFQTNRNSIAQLRFDLSDPRLPKAQKEVLRNSQYNQLIRKHLHRQTDDLSKNLKAFKDDPSGFFSDPGNQKITANRPRRLPAARSDEVAKKQSSLSRFLHRFGVRIGDLPGSPKGRSTGLPKGGQSFYWQRLRQRLEAEQRSKRNRQFASLKPFDSDYMFKYSLPNRLDLVMNKYNKKSVHG